MACKDGSLVDSHDRISRGSGEARRNTPNSTEEKSFEAADNLFKGAVIRALAENIVDSYMTLLTGKEMWDALAEKFGVSDAGNELYIMEQFHDYKMVDNHSVVEHALSNTAACKGTSAFPLRVA
jgi:hypothetical protein